MLLADNYQATDVLMLVITVTPVALYFLTLGLVNSHARPCLVTRRSDFVMLSSVLAPVLLWPIPMFTSMGTWWPMLFGALLAGLLFWRLLPTPDAGFVIYNISEARCVRLLDEATECLGLRGRWEGNTWISQTRDVRIHCDKFGLLRNVTIHVEGWRGETPEFSSALAAALQRRLQTIAQLPSAMGACLVLVGLSMMIVPMWLVGRHIDDLVDAMSHLFG